MKYREQCDPPKGAISPLIRTTSTYRELDFKTGDLCIIGELKGNYIRLDIINWDPPEEVPYDLDRNIENFKKYIGNEEYWYAHEEVEAMWLNSEGEHKEILQNIILLLASMVHYQMNRPESSRRLFMDSMKKLKERGLIQSEIEYSYPLRREYVLSLLSYLHKYSRYEKNEENKAEN